MEVRAALVPVYQQVTELVDEMMITGIANNFCQLTQAQAVVEAQGLIDRSLAGYYSAVTLQAHTDYQMTQWLDGVLAYAQGKGMPIWTAERWLAFTKARHDAVVDQVSWDGAASRLTFRISSAATEPSQTLLVPASHRSFPIASITVDGAGYAPGALSVKSFDYATVALTGGTHTVVVNQL